MQDPERRARPTIRCLIEDLGMDLPPEEIDLGRVDHPLIAETARLAPGSPQGQKRILAIDEPLVFRLRQGAWRGATWFDEQRQIVWLVAAHTREEGSRDDAYAYFATLHRNGRLLPDDDDHLRDRVESASRVLTAIEDEGAALLRNARAASGHERSALIVGRVEIRIFVDRSSDMEEIWLAVSTRDIDGAGVPTRLRDVIFATFELLAGGGEWEWRADWPTGELRWFERARMGLTPR